MKAKKSIESSNNPSSTVKSVLEALTIKKEVKLRFQNGEKLRDIAKEKGLEIVLPL
jgi:hypothetical protein